MALLKSRSGMSKWKTVSHVQIQDNSLEAGITRGLKIIWEAPKCLCTENAVPGFVQYSQWPRHAFCVDLIEPRVLMAVCILRGGTDFCGLFDRIRRKFCQKELKDSDDREGE